MQAALAAANPTPAPTKRNQPTGDATKPGTLDANMAAIGPDFKHGFVSRGWARVTSRDALQLPGLVADAVKAVDDLGVGIELQLVLDLLRIDQAIAQRAQLTVTRSGPQILLRFAR
jgi:hypothetical protein